MASESTVKTIAAQNTFSDPLRLVGHFNFSLSGTFSATVVVQRSPDGSTWADVDSFSSATEEVGYEPEVMFYRAGIKTGAYTSGSAVVRLAYDPQNRLN
jgi:hypothetical protein